MLNLKAIALATALSLSAAGAAVAETSALDALSSANTVSFVTVTGVEVNNVKPGAPGGDLVDLGSLKTRIGNNPNLLAQLENYGASIDDIVGINATSEQDVTIYIQG